LASIQSSGKLEDEVEKNLISLIEEFKNQFNK